MKICLITTPRSGSTSVYNLFYKRFGVDKNFKEIFNPKTYNWQGDHKEFIDIQYNNWLKEPSSISKIDPKHIYARTTRAHSKDILHNMLTKSDKIFYLYRRNTSEQITSLALAKKTDEWNQERNTLQDITEHEFEWCGENLLYRYLECLDLYEKYPGEVLCMEDILNYEPYKNKPETKYTYTGQNIEDLFKENK